MSTKKKIVVAVLAVAVAALLVVLGTYYALSIEDANNFGTIGTFIN